MRTVATAAGAIDPTVDRAPLAAKDAPDRDRALALVQFIGPPKDAWLERLRATGARLVGYQPENAYLVHARGARSTGSPACSARSRGARRERRDRGRQAVRPPEPFRIFAVTTVKGEATTAFRCVRR